jgi:beta-galactosidase
VGGRERPARRARDGVGQPTVVAFDPVTATRLRLDLTSAHPKAGDGFLAISALEVPGVALH